jgi:dTDP-glucose 4,6-dehydratase
MKFVVTGGRGFIGSHFVELLLLKGHEVIDIDKMTYASNKELPWDDDPKYELRQEDISTMTHLPPCDVVVNFAAESHVDNSIESPKVFFDSNARGVFNLLELVRAKVYNPPLFVQISTDEVYGDTRDKKFYERDMLLPSNPYSASKAAGEMFVFSHNKTYGLEYLITRSSNNYGPRQYSEKLIPKIIECLENKTCIPIHGDGSYIRDWVRVEDNVKAIYHLILSGERNEVFNIAADNHLTNIEVVSQVCSWYNIDDINPHVKYVKNRLGQDVRYSIDSEKLDNTGFTIEKNQGIIKFI